MDWLGQISPYSSFACRTIGWWILPGFATRAALNVYYAALPSIGLGHRIPPSNSPKSIQHYRRTFALVVVSYLLWTLAQTILEQPPSFYSLLGVDYHASDIEIKSAYRSFAKRYHPDKVGPAGQALFAQVRDAYEALKHPIKRYGYDRFGFEALEWKVAENPHAILWQGLENAMRYYMPTGLIMLVMAIMGWGGTSTYWRHVAWALTAALEACIIIGFNPLQPYVGLVAPILSQVTRPLSDVVPGLSLGLAFAPYQWAFVLRETFVSVAVAIGMVVPVVFPPPPSKKEEQARQAEIARLAIGLDPVVRDIIVQSAVSDMQAKELVHKELAYLDMSDPPLLPTDLRLSQAHRDALNSLAPSMQRLVVQHTLLSDPNLRAAFLEALGRTAEKLKQEDDARTITERLATIGRSPSPAPNNLRDNLRDVSPTPDEMSAKMLAIPSPPSSIFSHSREVTPEPTYTRTSSFDPSAPGFNYRASPGGNTPTYRATSISENRLPSILASSPAPSRGPRRPSLSPSKRPSTLSEVGLASPTSPIMVKQELA